MGLKKETFYIYETNHKDYKGQSIQDVEREMHYALDEHINSIQRHEERIKELLENVKQYRQWKQQSIDSANALKLAIKELQDQMTEVPK